MVSFDGVSKQFPQGSRLNALHEVSFRVEKGEFLFVTGPSGAGKSTLLKLVSMEEFPTEGEVTVGQYSSRTVRRRDLPKLRQKVGVVFQDFRLWRDWTIGENVAAALRVTGTFDAKELRQRTQEVLGVVGLAHRARSYPSHLSGGEQQRVAIARAIVNDPLVLLADEPTGNLDEEAGRHILELLRQIHYGGTSVVVATHDLDEIERVGGRVLLLEQGRLTADEVHRALE